MTHPRSNNGRATPSVMQCPVCGSNSVIVTDSRRGPENSIRRRRSCECGYRYTTYEAVGCMRGREAAALARIDQAIDLVRELASELERLKASVQGRPQITDGETDADSAGALDGAERRLEC